MTKAKDVQGFDGYLDILSSRPGMRPEIRFAEDSSLEGSRIRTIGPA